MRAEYQIAIDFGSTTLAFQLIGMQQGNSIHTVTMLNSQRKFGADVLTRIRAAVDGRKDELQQCAKQDLLAGIGRLQEECNIGPEQIKQIVIAGNPTMIHLLQGYDCSGLGVYPFAPVNLDFIKTSKEALGLYKSSPDKAETGTENTPNVIIFPGISAFVGGDIVAGLYSLDFVNKEEISLLVDLGTNGEMVLGNKDKAIAASVAAGPAFERGAVIWGSDVVDITTRLLKEGIMDETGLLADEYFDKGFPVSRMADGRAIVFTQQDIRKLQLAKAAVRAGIETLIEEYGITVNQIDKVYLAGGFGYYLDAKKAAYIGMIPEELVDRTEAIGNSSLAGCVKYLREEKGEKQIQKIVSSVKHVELANNDNFQQKYVKNMSFSL